MSEGGKFFILMLFIAAVFLVGNFLLALPVCATELKRIAAALEKANDLYMKQNGINRFKDS
jgi:hypothetical protein